MRNANFTQIQPIPSVALATLLIGLIVPSSGYAQPMHMMGSGMMWGMTIFWLLFVVLLVLIIAALVKYLFKR
jgi:uncharacterized membrane protein